MGRKEVPDKEEEVGFGSIDLLFGPSRNLRWEEQIRCLTHKDAGHLVKKGAYSPTSPPSPQTCCLFYSTSRGRRGGPPEREVSPTSQSHTFLLCVSSVVQTLPLLIKH